MEMNDEIKIIKELNATGKWSERDIRLGIGAKFKCEYCDLDLLASVNNYKEWNEDHIVPKSVIKDDREENMALACRTCNNIKGRWDVRKESKGNETRKELIKIIRNHIMIKRKKLENELNNMREIIYNKL